MGTYTGKNPGKSSASLVSGEAQLHNGAIRCAWKIEQDRLASFRVESGHTGKGFSLRSGFLPRIDLVDGRSIDLMSLSFAAPMTVVERTISAQFADSASGLALAWSATLDDQANAVIQSLSLTTTREIKIRAITFFDAALPGAKQIGQLDGSVVVCGDIFMAIENPLAKNMVAADHIGCSLWLQSELAAGESRSFTAMVGVVPPGQLRRGFLYYLERRRVHPYRQFLHYNNWFDVWLSRKTERMTEQECLDTIEYFGRELVEKRGVKMDAMVWDDGWDDFNTLWDFHRGFPDGFRNLMRSAQKYGISQGVWMSPNGGYSSAKAARIAYGKPLGYETNENGYAMGGPRYRKAFHDTCLRMIRENGVVFFKFDGMGEGGSSGKMEVAGASGLLSNDIQAILELSRELHREEPAVYISATAGTWASPFWLLYADSVWRQGGDTGFQGEGDTRQQWITYRDMFCFRQVAKAGPLYPHNALMLHGVVIGNRPGRAPAGLAFDEKSVADEVWSFFSSGTCLQELYVSPGVPTANMLDRISEAATWARENQDVLVDTHWVGGDPGNGEVYGRASWIPGKGILSLRNPSSQARQFVFTLKKILELPEGAAEQMRMRAEYPRDRLLPSDAMNVRQEIELKLEAFETVVMSFR